MAKDSSWNLSKVRMMICRWYRYDNEGVDKEGEYGHEGDDQRDLQAAEVSELCLICRIYQLFVSIVIFLIIIADYRGSVLLLVKKLFTHKMFFIKKKINIKIYDKLNNILTY